MEFSCKDCKSYCNGLLKPNAFCGKGIENDRFPQQICCSFILRDKEKPSLGLWNKEVTERNE